MRGVHSQWSQHMPGLTCMGCLCGRWTQRARFVLPPAHQSTCGEAALTHPSAGDCKRVMCGTRLLWGRQPLSKTASCESPIALGQVRHTAVAKLVTYPPFATPR